MRFLQFSAFRQKFDGKIGLNQKSVPNILKSGLFGICKIKLDEIGHISREQIELEYDTWKLCTKKVKIRFFTKESIKIPAFSTR
jgi:hypothetical protein